MSTRDVGVSPAMPLQEVIESCCRGRGLGTWASCPRCSSSMLSIHVVAGETPTSLRGCTSSAQWVVRDVGVSPATTIREAQQRNMPHGIAGETPTSLFSMRQPMLFLLSKLSFYLSSWWPGTWASRPRQKKDDINISVICLPASRAGRPRPCPRQL